MFVTTPDTPYSSCSAVARYRRPCDTMVLLYMQKNIKETQVRKSIRYYLFLSVNFHRSPVQRASTVVRSRCTTTSPEVHIICLLQNPPSLNHVLIVVSLYVFYPRWGPTPGATFRGGASRYFKMGVTHALVLRLKRRQ